MKFIAFAISNQGSSARQGNPQNVVARAYRFLPRSTSDQVIEADSPRPATLGGDCAPAL